MGKATAAVLLEKGYGAARRVEKIDAIALSHPHYYSSQVEWAEAFQVPIYIHEDDKEWISRECKHIELWTGECSEFKNDETIHRLGGHFKGGSVLHWEKGNNGNGVLLTGNGFESKTIGV